MDADLATFIRHATRYKPEERYQGAREMLAALRLLHPRLPDQGMSWAGLDEASVAGSASGFSDGSLPPISSLYPPLAPAGPPQGATIDAGLTMNLTGIGGMTIPSSAPTKYVTGDANELLRLEAQHTGFDPMDEHKTPFTIMPRDVPSDDEPTSERAPVAVAPTSPGDAPVNTRTAIVSSVVSAVIATLVVATSLWLRDEPTSDAAPAPQTPVTALAHPPAVGVTAPVEAPAVEATAPEPAPLVSSSQSLSRPVAEPSLAETQEVGVPSGTLGINSIPWSHVVIDGEERGTSGKRFAVDAGQHTIELRTEAGIETRATLDVTAGSTRIYCWDFAKGTECLR
jgi:hypothetical protein